VKRSVRWTILLSVILALLATVALTATFLFDSSKSHEGPRSAPFEATPPEPALPKPAPSSPPTPESLPSKAIASTPPPRAAPPIAACCDGDRPTCASGRDCTPGDCRALPERTWKLRVAGAAERSGGTWKDLAPLRPGAQVCVTTPRSGEECAPLASPEADPTRLPIATTSDLLQGRIGLHVIDGDRDLYMAHADPIPAAGLTTKVLCTGLTLDIGPPRDASARVTLHLDDP